jgi:anti-sigma B factor antagonist
MTAPSPASFKVVERGGTAITVEVSGEVDVASTPAMRSYLNECLAQGYTEVTLDLTSLTFIDSSGLGVVVGVINQLRHQNGRLIIRNPPPIAVQVLRISGLTSFLEIVPRTPTEGLDESGQDT